MLSTPFTSSGHFGGQVAFGPDGFLYISWGDGLVSEAAQDPASWRGKLLRIDVEGEGAVPYRVPPTNPFVTRTNFLPEIWALGLRNPWRFSFDRLSGDLYIGDVGGTTKEEIDFQAVETGGGQNYGWPFKEGTIVTSSTPFTTNVMIDPVHEYGTPGVKAVIGGFVYRGPNASRMQGVYFYGDFGSGAVSGLKRDSGMWQSQFLATRCSMSSFGEDEAGRLYLADRCAGKLYRIDDSGLAYAPTFSPSGQVSHTEFIGLHSATPGAVIHYTLDGSEPSLTSSEIPSGGTISVLPGQTIKALAYRADLLPSEVSSVTYSFQTAPPRFYPPSSLVTNGTRVEISTATPSSTIRYSFDGSEPTELSTEYRQPLVVTQDVWITARAFKDGYEPGESEWAGYSVGNYEEWMPKTRAVLEQLSALPWDDSPFDLCVDRQGCLYVADFRGHRIYKVSPDGIVSSFAGTGVPGYVDGPAETAQFASPWGMCADGDGNIFVSDSGNFRIRRIDPMGLVTTVAGNGELGIEDGPAHQAQFNELFDIDIDASGNLVVKDGALIRRVSVNGDVQTLFNTQTLGFGPQSPWIGVSAAGDVFFWQPSDLWPSQVLFRLSITGDLEPFAGDRAIEGVTFDGPKHQARFYYERSDVVPDRLGNVFVAEGSWIRVIRPDGLTRTTGADRQFGYSDTANRWRFFKSLSVDASGNLFSLDQNQVIRLIPSDWEADGIPDIAEGGTTPFVIGVDDRVIDTDHDGASNSDEFKAGTDPNDSKSVLKVSIVYAGDTAIVSFPCLGEKEYRVWTSNDLETWTEVSDPTFTYPSPGHCEWTDDGKDTGGLGSASRFYRVTVE